MKRRISDILVTVYISGLLIYLVIGNSNRLYQLYTTQQISEVLVYFGSAGLLIYIFNKVLNKIKFDIYDLIMLLLVIFGVISTIYAIDFDAALHGFSGRYEGLLQIVTYYILFLNCKNIDNKICKYILISVIILLGCFQAIYGVLQFADVSRFLDHEIIRKRFYSTGVEVNPNFFSTAMILTLALSIGIYMFKKNVFVSIVTLITSSVLFFGLLCSGAMSGMVAFIALIIVIFILFFVLRPNIWWTISKVVIMTVCLSIVFYQFNKLDGGYYSYQMETTAFEFGEAITGESMPWHGTGRIHIWTETLKVVPDNLWNGVGIDNFFNAFGENEILVDIESKLAVDKAHNEYLQKLVTEGIFSFIVYMGLLLLLGIKSIVKIFKERQKDDVLFITLFLSFGVYCVQAFFNISVISVAPLFYIVMGLLCSLVKKKVKYEEVKSK